MPSTVYPLFRLLTGQSARLILPATSAAALRRVRRLMALGGGWAPLARGVRSQRAVAGGVPAEWMAPAGVASPAVLLYLHGGGWTLGLDPAHRILISHIARAAGLRTLSLDYRLAPEHPFPAALDDCLAAYAWLQAQGYPGDRIVLAGDSAGANLALALAHALSLRRQPLPAAVACLSGVFDLEFTGESFRTNADALLNPDYALAMVGHYAHGRNLRDPLISPLWGDLSGFPPLSAIPNS